ncbi:penicillin-binding protein 1A [Pseudoalteromonas luteoviolacea]|uniref:Penicillin-binding protein 1A n=1 Tax=Pseudoalteromonas luteoviolacea S4054 TaxID=1129367 RepID=A0A0F6A6K0_9GAMM|nr:PBP1A family penicillin-binding protein [Pseudoalteromonas luteoviolacea]AOT06612.1 penicillin-sensitive transpeptidase [Pseudoalteromonas luteoviolacea]AOT11529.1 penicillin-sensitive transpeptidase [Pseudoalteromonas luteoviolacea]AOT16442.1 penicillin-sensitive transpeptidase [Pseudoalteromonas luteoviolacea]KKE81069.1 penicillin-binding protein 1a [Pseudoalteromonas luteoviolacea S4054]KZN62523.1 penicillin-binding protein 1a [Pseudoalteromonas luteoviolacea S4047-1]
MNLLKRLLQTVFVFGLFGLVILIGLYFYVKSDIPSVSVLKDVQLQTPMQVFTRDGKLINQFGEKRRIPVKISDVPKPMLNAFLATEDNRFYEHFGIDPIGIVRSFIVLVSTGQKKQGASTITMQLARNFFLTREKAYIRKVKEIFIALHIERLLSKDEIFELYLNKIELGHRSFGIGAAAQVYYGKELSELTLPQMAMIAGLPKAPSALNPIRNPTRAKARRNVVLGRMLAEKYISEAEYQAAVNAPITAKRHGAEIELYAPYISEMVRAYMVETYGTDTAYNSGFRVYTTVDASTQAAAQQALVNNLHDYDMRHGFRGPNARYWQPDETPWDARQITARLSKVKAIAPLNAAVVTAIDEKSAEVMLKTGEVVSLDWSAINWARAYITERRQGSAPKTAADILEPGMQIWVRQTNQKWMLSQLPQPASALVSLDPKNGQIKALVGGYSFKQSQYNRAVQAKRQVGSNIKPFIYSAALEENYTLATIINDAPINHWDKSLGVAWRPKNSPDVYSGPIRIRRALAQSKNVVSVRLMRGVGLNNTADHILKFGFDDADVVRSESLALGSAAMTPLEMARGMSAFANGGHLIEPYFIDRLTDAFGNELGTASPLRVCNEDELEADPYTCAPRIISEKNAFLVADALKSAIWGGGSWRHKTGWTGTGWRAQTLKRKDLAGKTGTTNNAVDTWFTGFNRNLLTTVWVGFDDASKPLGRAAYNSNLGKKQIVGAEAGATSAQPAWVSFMRHALKEAPLAPIEPPPGLVSIRIDLKTGLLSEKNDYTSRFEYFERGTAPTKYVLDSGSSTPFEDALPATEELF